MTEQQSVGALLEGAFIGPEFPLAPDAVLNAYRYYWRVTHTTDTEQRVDERAMRTTNTLASDFCDTQVTPQIYTAAMLGHIADALGDPIRGRNALRGLKVYGDLSNESPEDKRFIFGLLSDRPIIHNFWHEQTQGLYANEPERLALLNDETNQLPIPDAMWQRKSLGANASEILKLRTEHGVNVESFLIEATETLQWLQSDAAGNDTATLQKLHAAEALYAPFCEIIGFDGLAMALQGRCHELRLINTGRGDVVEHARVIIESMGTPDDVHDKVESILKELLGDNLQEKILTHFSRHGIVIGEGLAREELLRIVWRQKTVGSLARKLAQLEDGKMPMDVIAATVITKDATEIGQVLDTILQQAIDSPRTNLLPSPSRDLCMHVKGTEDYIEQIRQAMGFPDRASMDDYIDVVPVGPEQYQVAKITFTYQRWGEPWPQHVEIQLNTEKDRVEARIGSAAHALFKLTGGVNIASEKEIAAIRELHAQKEHLGQNGLTPLSRQRADQLEARLSGVQLVSQRVD